MDEYQLSSEEKITSQIDLNIIKRKSNGTTEELYIIIEKWKTCTIDYICYKNTNKKKYYDCSKLYTQQRYNRRIEIGKKTFCIKCLKSYKK